MFRRRLAGNHDFRALNERDGRLAAAQAERRNRIARDDGGQCVVTDSEPNLRQHPLATHLFDNAAQLIAGAQGDDGWRRGGRRRSAVIREASRIGKKSLDFARRHAVMPTLRSSRPDGALVNPLFERRVADADSSRCLPHGEQAHRRTIPDPTRSRFCVGESAGALRFPNPFSNRPRQLRSTAGWIAHRPRLIRLACPFDRRNGPRARHSGGCSRLPAGPAA